MRSCPSSRMDGATEIASMSSNDSFHPSSSPLASGGAGVAERAEDETPRLAGSAANDRAPRTGADSLDSTRLIAAVAHDLRSPLNTIRGWTHLLRQQHDEPPALHARALEAMERNTLLLAATIEQLVELWPAQVEHHAAAAPRALDGLVRAAVERAQPWAGSRNVTLVVDTGADRTALTASTPGLGNADPLLAAALGALMAAALKQADNGSLADVKLAGRRVTLRSLRTRSPTSARELRDALGLAKNGDALAPPQPWLCLARRVVEDHNGKLALTDLEDTLDLTFDFGSANENLRDENTSGIARQDNKLEGMRVAIVDDDDDNRELLALLLAGSGATVQPFASGAAALADLTHHREVDLVISDLSMPGMDGCTLLERLRNNERDLAAPRVPAIAATSHDGADARARCSAAGFDAHFSKPLDSRLLLNAVRRIYNRMQRRRPSFG